MRATVLKNPDKSAFSVLLDGRDEQTEIGPEDWPDGNVAVFETEDEEKFLVALEETGELKAGVYKLEPLKTEFGELDEDEDEDEDDTEVEVEQGS